MKRHLLIIFALFIVTLSSKSVSSQIEYCYDWDAVVYGYSELLHNDQAYLVSGIAGTEIVVFDYTPYVCDNDYTAWVYSELANSSGVLSYGRLESNDWDVEGRHPVFNAQPRTYCVTSAHGLVAYMVFDNGEIIQFETAEILAGYTQDCHTFPPPPTPTPTPTPCPPGLDSCPDPAATISQINLVEKYGLADVTVGVSNAAGVTTTFSLRTTAGTGSATFDDGTATKSFTGNVNNQVLRVKGVIESSQIDNLIVEAKHGNRLLASDNFTVAVIESLDFQLINADDSPIDDNPGTDGIHTPEEGQRIFPDKNTPTDGTDRSILRVRADVAPAGLPNLKVYFASFDLDDPSANTPPIDANMSVGDDNNGAVNNSKSGEFVQPVSGCAPPVTAANVSKIDCSVLNKAASTSYMVTMQPGDNYAVVASLVETYRSAIHLDPNAGENLVNAANQIIPVSGEANPNNVQGIRTRMLTTWRKLHIEVDSMGVASGNKVEGTMTETKKISTGTKTLMVNPTNPVGSLEPDRFENGRMVINGRSYQIIDAVPATATSPAIVANTADSVTIRVLTTFNITPTSTFTLYDDDDMDDDGGGYQYLNGDEGDDVPEPPDSLVRYVDTPCSATVTTGCNVFAPAYVKPIYDLTGSHENTGFNTNINVSIDPVFTVPPAEIQAWFNFDNVITEANPDFWTVYLMGAYQYDSRRDNDPSEEGGILGTVDRLNGQGLLIFSEITRPTEIPNFAGRPVGRHYTLAHEVGHLFYGEHEDLGLMTQTSTRTVGTFDERTLNKIRGGEFTDQTGVTRTITHP